MSQSPSRAFKNAAYAHIAEVGKALSSPARIEILELLAQASRTVEVLAGEISQSVANTSHHLQALKRAHLVTTERDGLYVIYSLAGGDIAELIAQLQSVAARHSAELEKLTREFFDDPTGLEPVDGDELLERLRVGDVVLLDVRPEREYAEGHLPGALSMPLSVLESRIDELPRDCKVVAYCRGPFCTFSAEAVRRLRERGFEALRADVSVHSLSLRQKEHWDAVYRSKAPDSVSWYRPRLEQSLAWIEACGLGSDAHIVDVGGGASTLVDDLVERGFERLSVVDLSKEALAHSRARLGDAAEAVQWVVGDATTRLFEEASIDLWHDRAVFHFLTDETRRDAYVEELRASLRSGGFAIIATFGPTGPERCSGLPVTRYASADIAAALGEGFELIDQADDEHVTPWGAPQDFSYALLRRV